MYFTAYQTHILLFSLSNLMCTFIPRGLFWQLLYLTKALSAKRRNPADNEKSNMNVQHVVTYLTSTQRKKKDRQKERLRFGHMTLSVSLLKQFLKEFLLETHLVLCPTTTDSETDMCVRTHVKEIQFAFTALILSPYSLQAIRSITKNLAVFGGLNLKPKEHRRFITVLFMHITQIFA